MGEFKRSFWTDFSLTRFVVKVIVLYTSLNTGIVGAKEFEPAAKPYVEYYVSNHLPLRMFVPYVIVMLVYEVIKLQVKQDLAYVQWEHRRRRKKR